MEENKGINGADDKLEPKDEEDDLPKSKEELMALLQKEGDRRVTEALKKQEAKNKKAIEEAKKLASMNEDEKYKYELEQREKAIEEKEKALALLENTNEASKILNERGMSLSLVDLVVKETAEDTLEAINLLDKEFKKSVKAEVEKRLAGNTPKKGLATDKTLTKEQFMKLSYSELAELKKNEPELYESMVNGRY